MPAEHLRSMQMTLSFSMLGECCPPHDCYYTPYLPKHYTKLYCPRCINYSPAGYIFFYPPPTNNFIPPCTINKHLSLTFEKPCVSLHEILSLFNTFLATYICVSFLWFMPNAPLQEIKKRSLADASQIVPFQLKHDSQEQLA